MNTSQLRAFVTVVDEGSFSEAARVMGISQPAVTMQVQALESAVGATLLDRRYRRVDLTEAGRILLPSARRIISQLESAKERIDALSGVVTGHLKIAASTTPGVYVVPRLLGAFVSRFPEVRVTIDVHDTADVVAAVDSGDAHLGIAGATVRSSRLTFEEIAGDEIVLIAPANSPLARSAHVLGELAEEPWIMREEGSGTRRIAETVLSKSGVDPNGLPIVTELGASEAIVNAVEGGLGISIVSRLAAAKALELGTVALIDAEGLPAPRPFYIVQARRAPSRASEAFVDHLRIGVGVS